MTIFRYATENKRCYLCQERGTRPAGKAEYDVAFGPDGKGESEEYDGVCGNCADDLVEHAQYEKLEWTLIGHV